MGNPVPASVLFLRLRAFHEHPVGEQARQRERLLAAARLALAPWAADQRLVLEALDGLAVVSRGEPRLALAAARAAAAACTDADVGIGLHHGTVRVDGDAATGASVSGEGLETAAALAASATPTQALVLSPAFRAALSARHRVLRRTLLGLAGVGLVLGTGVAARARRLRIAAAHRPATIALDLRPQGEVYVDGELKGTAPPLARLSIPPGPHSIELRSGRSRPVTMQVHLQPGEELALKHVFAAPPAPPVRRAAPSARSAVVDRVKSWLDELK
jgi:hypothetical protein